MGKERAMAAVIPVVVAARHGCDAVHERNLKKAFENAAGEEIRLHLAKECPGPDLPIVAVSPLSSVTVSPLAPRTFLQKSRLLLPSSLLINSGNLLFHKTKNEELLLALVKLPRKGEEETQEEEEAKEEKYALVLLKRDGQKRLRFFGGWRKGGGEEDAEGEEKDFVLDMRLHAPPMSTYDMIGDPNSNPFLMLEEGTKCVYANKYLFTINVEEDEKIWKDFSLLRYIREHGSSSKCIEIPDWLKLELAE